MPGKLELIVGPMRSTKTAELLRRIETRRQYAKQYVLLLKPSDDTKAAAGLVESRNQNGCGRMEAMGFSSSDPWAVLPVLTATEQQIGKRVECVAIDEGQFVQDLFLFTKRLLDSGHDVMVSGLELDFRGLPFGEMIDLIVSHFHNEEAVMRINRYPNTDHHIELHSELFSRLTDILYLLETGSDRVAHELVQCIDDWAHLHILVQDRMIVDYLEANQL